MKKFLALVILPVSLFSLFIGFKFPIQADSKNIFINEFLPDGVGADSGKEWVELYNNSHQDIDLNGWKIGTKTTTSTTPRTFTITNFSIKSKSFLIISEFGNLEGIDFINAGSGKLNMYNSNAEIFLSNPDGVVVDNLVYELVGEGKSLERRGPVDSAQCSVLVVTNVSTLGTANTNKDNNCWPIAPVSLPVSNPINNPISSPVTNLPNYQSPSIPISFPVNEAEDNEPKIPDVDVDYPAIEFGSQSSVVISEIYASPNKNLGEFEWLEIYNQDILKVELSGMYFKERAGDAIGTSKSLLPSTTLNPGEYLVINEASLNISLNNSGDSIFLLDENDTIVDNFVYDTMGSNQSASRVISNRIYDKEYINNKVPITTIITPNGTNKFPSATISSIKDLKNLKVNDLVKAKGYINSRLGIFEDDSVYIQLDGFGVRVFLDLDTTKVDLRYGYLLELVGLLKTNSDGNLFIEVKDLSAVQTFSEFENISFTNLNIINELDQSVNTLVTFKGELFNNHGTTFSLKSEKFNIKVKTSSTLGELPNKTTGDEVEVSGLLVKDGDEFIIIPDSSSEIKIFKVEEVSSKTSTSKKVNPSTPSDSEVLGSSINSDILNFQTQDFEDAGDKIYSNPSTQYPDQETKIYPWPVYLGVSSISLVELLRTLVKVLNIRTLL